EVEDGRHVVSVTPPVVICALTGLNEPRYPSLKGIMAARRKPIEDRQLADPPSPGAQMTWGSLRQEERAVEGTVIDDEPESAAKQVVAILKERNLI
ncbi:MAG: electron transfer flavoprotein subunit beta, partial [Chloroflexia bacterium]|nr:electron transfer flavoprotein subunit beta [Chloroflexia bacterium]